MSCLVDSTLETTWNNGQFSLPAIFYAYHNLPRLSE